MSCIPAAMPSQLPSALAGPRFHNPALFTITATSSFQNIPNFPNSSQVFRPEEQAEQPVVRLAPNVQERGDCGLQPLEPAQNALAVSISHALPTNGLIQPGRKVQPVGWKWTNKKQQNPPARRMKMSCDCQPTCESKCGEEAYLQFKLVISSWGHCYTLKPSKMKHSRTGSNIEHLKYLLQPEVYTQTHTHSLTAQVGKRGFGHKCRAHSEALHPAFSPRASSAGKPCRCASLGTTHRVFHAQRQTVQARRQLHQAQNTGVLQH